ncbi:MAG: hypothetical protein SFW35_06200 [Chitinophagales bacterium]|nr:hypothetical protein [Chitinophagales bacterium]
MCTLFRQSTVDIHRNVWRAEKQNPRIQHLAIVQIFLPLSLFVCLTASFSVSAQILASNDTLHLKHDCKIVYNDTTVILLNDTVMIFPAGDTVKIRNRAMVRIFNDLFRIDPTAGKPDSLIFIESAAYFRKYKGKVIGKIDYQKVEVFGSSIYDTSKGSENWFINAGNAVHVDTRKKEIEHNMMVKEGEKVDPAKLADNERILRNLPYINDARIAVVPRGKSDTIDLIVITRDVWSLDFGFGAEQLNQVHLDLTENNLFGLGHQFGNRIYLGLRPGYEGYYQVQNLGGSFMTGRLYYANVYQRTTYEVGAAREFLSADVKYGGGLSFKKENLIRAFNKTLSDSTMRKINYAQEDAWFGRSFEYIPHRNGDYRSRSSIILAARVVNTHYSRRPILDLDTNAHYQNNTLFLGSVSFSQRNYYKSNLIFGFGRTEDVPYGRLFQFTAGYSLGELYNRGYIGMTISRGIFLDKVGYFNASASWGTFLHNSEMEQGVLRLKLLYFTDLYKIRKFNLRFIARTNYTLGINQPNENYIDLIETNGIRGLQSFELYGKQRFGFSVENSIFTPWYLLGFRVGLYYFLDMGYINQGKEFVFDSRPYYGLGAGVRFKNENLNIPTLQIGFAVYPAPPYDNSLIGFSLSSEGELMADDFAVKAPAVIDFR